MDPADDKSGPKPPRAVAQQRWIAAPLALLVASAVLLVAVFVANLQSHRVALALLISLISALVVFSLLLADMIRNLRRSEREAKGAFEDSEQDFHDVAENIHEVFWMMNPRTNKATFVTRAYETITGRSSQSLIEEPRSYERAIHPEDRGRILDRLADAVHGEHFEETFRIVRPDGEVRWVWVHGFPRKDSNGNVIRLGGTALDISAQKQAEEQVAANLAKANSAWAEAEAMRKATLALTEDLHMDTVLEALLRSLAALVPYACARVLVPEGGPHWLALAEKSFPESAEKLPRKPLTFSTDDCSFFRRLSSERQSVLIRDTEHQEEWETFPGHTELRSWLAVPLLASDEFLGFLSVGHLEPNRFTEDHLRCAQLLAIPAAVAIQNARLYSTAEMYGSELEKRLADLEDAERALDRSEQDRKSSEEKFQKIFHSSPIPFSIMTLDEGRFLEVNPAFEGHCGYARAELLGHTVEELRIFENPTDRRLLVAQLKGGKPIRGGIARLRAKSGELRVSAYAANQIQFDGRVCIFTVCEVVPGSDAKQIH